MAEFGAAADNERHFAAEVAPQCAHRVELLAALATTERIDAVYLAHQFGTSIASTDAAGVQRQRILSYLCW